MIWNSSVIPKDYQDTITKEVLEQKVTKILADSIHPETGETIYSIARLYNVSVTSLAKLNKLDAEFTIYVGKNIIVPITEVKTNPQKDEVKSASKKSLDIQKNNTAWHLIPRF